MPRIISSRGPSTSRITVVQCDDSEAIYENGVLVVEGFVLSPSSVLSAVGLSSELGEADLDWFEEQGRAFPTDLCDVCWRK